MRGFFIKTRWIFLMSEQLKQLKAIFYEIFQFDQADLDFGIYRIMRQKREEVDRYIEENLVNDLNHSFDKYNVSIAEDIQRQLNEAINNATALGFDPEASPKVNELRQLLSNLKHVETQKESVLSDLVQFLGRYYKEGDFLSLPRYRKNSYAIEYNGEEVKLHWANADQYYVKTAERFRDYRFLLPDGKAVHFKILAANTEAGNNKTETGKERRFQLLENDFMKEEDGELLIFFQYATDEQKRKQAEINAETVKRILEEVKNFIEWRKALGKVAPTEKNKDRTLLEKHLNDYTARNTFDYFIHKDLEGFLRRELDFYVKNEIVMLDDIENEDAPRVELYLAKVKALRRIGHKLIAFLAQVENFCKKLFLKKKFIIRANYCVTLDRVPRNLWSDILNNDAQIQEWREFYALDDIESDLQSNKGNLSEEFLEANQNLIIDTRHFSEDWKLKLLENFDDLDAITDGLLIKADNFQALNLFQEKYYESIKCIYIDPPYNTSDVGFLYKNGYKHSSWLSMIENRLTLGRNLISNEGVLGVAIDDTETNRLRILLDDMFGQENRLATIAIEVNPAGQNIRPNVPALSHDYCHFYAKNINQTVMSVRELTEEEKAQYTQKDKKGFYLWDNLRRRGGNSRPIDRPKQWFPLYADVTKGIVSVTPFEGAEKIEPIDPKGEKRIWRVNIDGAIREIKNGEISVLKKAGRIEIVKKSRMPEGKKPKTLWKEGAHSATSHGTNLLRNILPSGNFSYPKSLYLVQDSLKYWIDDESTVIDFFAGSGTTAHAIINLNREDDGRRKYVLVETSEYFDTVTLPRVKKVVYSKDWKDGKPVSREGSSHLLKYFALESYEDAMNNLALNKSDELQQAGLKFTSEFREDYLLNYMIEFETQGSQSLLNLDNFTAPFDYKMKIAVNGVGETRETSIDLIETFNYLIGLYVEKMKQIDGFRIVRGKTRTGERCLILWRTIKDLKQELADKRLNDFLEKQNFDFSEIDTLYINGDVAIPMGNVRKENETWQIKMIEAEFLKRMFE
jgi:adenine-specific DNA-methyltransferase